MRCGTLSGGFMHSSRAAECRKSRVVVQYARANQAASGDRIPCAGPWESAPPRVEGACRHHEDEASDGNFDRQRDAPVDDFALHRCRINGQSGASGGSICCGYRDARRRRWSDEDRHPEVARSRSGSWWAHKYKCPRPRSGAFEYEEQSSVCSCGWRDYEMLSPPRRLLAIR